MLEKCTNCGERIIAGGIRQDDDIFCSEGCRRFHGHPGFCASCEEATVDEPTGSVWSINGTGMRLIGACKRCETCNSVTTRLYFCFAFIPIIPLNRYRVLYAAKTPVSGSFLSRRMKSHTPGPPG